MIRNVPHCGLAPLERGHTPPIPWACSHAARGATDAEANGHLIGGTLPKVDADWNLGFFAVVAEKKQGSAIIIR